MAVINDNGPEESWDTGATYIIPSHQSMHLRGLFSGKPAHYSKTHTKKKKNNNTSSALSHHTTRKILTRLFTGLADDSRAGK